MAVSYTGEETIAKAREAYSYDMISEEKLEHIIKQVETNPAYNPILDLPLAHQLEHERELRRAAEKRQRRAERRGLRKWL